MAKIISLKSKRSMKRYCSMTIYFVIFLLIAVCMAACKRNDSNKISEAEFKDTITLPDSYFPFGPKELIAIFNSIPTDSLYVEKKYANDSLRLIYGENFEYSDVNECSGWAHVWAYKSDFAMEGYPEIQHFAPSSKDAFVLTVTDYGYQDLSLVVFSKENRDRMIHLFRKEGYLDFIQEQDTTCAEDGSCIVDIKESVFRKIGKNDKDPVFHLTERDSCVYWFSCNSNSEYN